MSISVMGRENLVHNMSKFKADLVSRLATAMEIVQSKVVNSARSRHGARAHAAGRFETQTGGLEESISAGAVYVGEQSIRGVVEARMPYASFVEQGTSSTKPYPFMLPAILENQNELIARVKQALHATGA